MTKFKDLFESRKSTKDSYLQQSYSQETLSKMIQSSKVYIQYNEPRSRGKIGGGNIKKITKDGVLIDNRFGDVDFLVKFSEITMATKIK